MRADRFRAQRLAFRLRRLLRSEPDRRRTRRRSAAAQPALRLGDHGLQARRTPGATTGRLRNEIMGTI
jgi:hypothetical protein